MLLLFQFYRFSTGTKSAGHSNGSHHLQYQTDGLGNKIIDFSSAGYQGGGIALPSVPVRVTVNASGGDDTANIQNAIDQVSQMNPDVRGFRGAVLLAPGSYTLSGTININASGVVLRGSGSGSGGTVFTLTGSPSVAINIAGSGSAQTVGTPQPITDSYVPSGANTVTVADTSSFAVGQTVFVQRPVTAAWIHFMGMDTLVRNGSPQRWIGTSTVIKTDRTIQSIQGNQLTFDAPLTDSFDSQFLTGSVIGYTFPGRISHVGIEHISMIAPPNTDISTPQFSGVNMDNVINSWLKDLVFQDTQGTVTTGASAKAITMDQVITNHTFHLVAGGPPSDFSIRGTQIFLNRCASNGIGNGATNGAGEWPMVLQSGVTGPIVLLNFTSNQDHGIGGHQRWGTGMLSDNAILPSIPDGERPGIAYWNRGNLGSGQGWATGWSVAWNVTTPYFAVQQFPGGQNWCIGCVGTKLTAKAPGGSDPVPDGIYDSLGTFVSPSSLYLAQLEERKGPAALAAIGYADFALTSTPASQTVAAGATASYNLAVTPSNGFNEDVHLVLIGARAGIGVQLESNVIGGGSGSTTLNVSTSPSTAPGKYTFIVTGRDGNLFHSATVTLTVQ